MLRARAATSIVSAYLSRFAPARVGPFHGFAVDITDMRVAPATKSLLSSSLNVTYRNRDASLMEELRGGPLIDLCFIDAKHTYAATREDYMELAPHCRNMLFHDVFDSDSWFKHADHGTVAFWAHLKANVDLDRRVREFVEQSAIFPPALGLGLLLPNVMGDGRPETNFTNGWYVGEEKGRRSERGCIGCHRDK